MLEAQSKAIASRTSCSLLPDRKVQELLPATVPPTFQTPPDILKNMQGADNTVIIPSILTALANAFGEDLQIVNGYRGFTFNHARVVDTQANAVFGTLKPDLTLYDPR